MAFERPTLNEIIERVENDIKGALGILTILRRSFLSAISRAIAGVAHVLHGHLVFISRQVFPDQAEVEYLDRWGSIYGLERQAATFTQLNIEVTFTAAATVTAGTVFQRSDQVQYEVDSDIVALGAGTETGTVTAIVAGSDSNISDGSSISLLSPLANVQSDATVLTTAVEGEDREADDDYRLRLVERIQDPPSGGTVTDYIAWAKTVSGVTRAWVYPAYYGEGTVGVTFVQDNDTPSIIPDAAEVDAVQDAIDALKPVTAGVTVFAPTAETVDIDISITPNTAPVQAAVLLELEDLFRREAAPRGSYKTITTTNEGRIALSRIDEAISIAADEEDHVITNLTASPQASVNGAILVLGTVTFASL